MTEINIEYCVPCGLLEYAVETQEQLLEAFGRDLAGVRLQPGHGGVFRVHAGDELIWDKDDHDGEIDPDAITNAVDERVAAD
jgi:selenoprotein W-related protein